ncbi:unnamed protein product [Moneuplotes crassus]|uniref:RING-type domain-containing protein n=1 Tax=Euplotes crassus TaxID=5936 RepID=A0AAD1Y2N5_EUPCR|nr:unnamed protein product [Moneuplotes crassus]
MSRAKPWRSKPTFVFGELLNATKNKTFYLVHEPGPTNLVIQDEHKKKNKVQIGSIISCTCGGGQKEHCIHTIFALLRIFKIPEDEPLLWQLSYSDREINKIIQNRERGMFRLRNGEEVKTHTGFLTRKTKKEEKKTVKRAAIEDDEPCCICFDEMLPDENLTYCKYGCGHNIHMDCAKHLVKHKKSEKKQILCPLCRCNWGENALEELVKESRIFRANKIAEENEKLKKEFSKNMPKCVSCNEHAADAYTYKNRSVQIFSCNICRNKWICKSCYDQKKEIFKDIQKKDRREKQEKSMQNNDEYLKIMQEIQTRDLSANDYDLLLKLDNQKAKNSEREGAKCKFCESHEAEELKENDLSVLNLPCNHCFHKYMVRYIGDKKDRKSQFRMSQHARKEYNKKLEESKGPEFGLVGFGVTPMEISKEVDSKTLYTQKNRKNAIPHKYKSGINKRSHRSSNSVKPAQNLDFNLNGKNIGVQEISPTLMRPPLPGNKPPRASKGISKNSKGKSQLNSRGRKRDLSDIRIGFNNTDNQPKAKGHIPTKRMNRTKLRIARDVQAFNSLESSKMTYSRKDSKRETLVKDPQTMNQDLIHDQDNRNAEELEELFPEIRSITNSSQNETHYNREENKEVCVNNQEMKPEVMPIMKKFTDSSRICEDQFSDICPDEDDFKQTPREEEKKETFEYQIPTNPIVKLNITRNPSSGSHASTMRNTEPENEPSSLSHNMNVVTLGQAASNSENTADSGNNENIEVNTAPSLRIRKKPKRKIPAPKPPKITKRRENNNFVPDLAGKGICGIGIS